MATEHQHQGHDTHDEAAAPAAPAATPGLDAVQHVTGGGDPAASQIIQIVRANPSERDEIFTWLHQHRGNAFVQLVTQKMGQIEQGLPEQLDVQAVRATMMIPGDRKLAGGLFHGYSIKTSSPTQVNAEVTRTGLKVWLSPGMYLDANWPLRDCTLEGASLQFGSNAPHVDITDGGGLGAIPIRGWVTSKITGVIHGALGGTKLVQPDYDPMRDTDLQGTLDRVMQGFVDTFSEHDDTAKKKAPGKSPVGPEEMTRVSAGATVAVRGGAVFAEGGSGISIAANAPIDIAVDGAGSIADLTAGHDAHGVASGANVQAVRLDTEGLEVMVKGKPVARLESMRLARGGVITVERMTPLGKLAKAEAAEAGISGLLTLLALASHDPAANDLYRNTEHPQIVDGVSRKMIEKEFTETIHKLILQYRNAVPGVDLAAALGIG
jgi:hypothetical protein